MVDGLRVAILTQGTKAILWLNELKKENVTPNTNPLQRITQICDSA